MHDLGRCAYRPTCLRESLPHIWAFVKELHTENDNFLTESVQVIVIKLRAAMEAYKRKHGHRLTYEGLSEAAAALGGAPTLSQSALNSIENEEGYNPTLKVVNLLCRLMDTSPQNLLEQIADEADLTHPLDIDELRAIGRQANSPKKKHGKSAKKKRPHRRVGKKK